MIIIFEGVDRVGKTTAIRKFNEQTNFEHIIVDRMFISHYVYAKKFGRKINKEYYKTIENLLGDNLIIVYLYGNVQELENRCIITKHEPIDFQKDMELFDKYFEDSTCNVISINTSINSIDETVEKIIEEVEKYASQ
jgi:thymidylate kinase